MEIRFSDVTEVEGYIVRHATPGALGPASTVIVITTDKLDDALQVMRKDPRNHTLKMTRLYRTPDGRLLWKGSAEVVQS